MKNTEKWRESKFTWKNGKLCGSRNPSELQVSSRLVADIIASHYQRNIPMYASGALIDLGCGRVPFYALYKDYVSSVTCVDWQNSLHQNPFLDLTCNLTEALPFPDESFDTILLSDVLEHIPEPESLWREMERILKPGGKIIVNVPFYYKIHEAPHDYFRYTEFSLRRFTEKNNLMVVVLTSTGGIPEILSDLMAKFSFKLPIVGKAISIMIQSICKYFIKTTIGKNISSKTGEQFPLGYFMVVSKSSAPIMSDR